MSLTWDQHPKYSRRPGVVNDGPIAGFPANHHPMDSAKHYPNDMDMGFEGGVPETPKHPP